MNDIVYSIDTQGDLSKKITSAAKDGTSLTSQSLSEISDKIDLFHTHTIPIRILPYIH